MGTNRKPIVDVAGRQQELPVGDTLVDGSGNPITGGGGSPGGTTNSLQTNDGAGGFSGNAAATLAEYTDINAPSTNGMRITLTYGSTDGTIIKRADSFSFDTAADNLTFSAGVGVQFTTAGGGEVTLTDAGLSSIGVIDALQISAGTDLTLSGYTGTVVTSAAGLVTVKGFNGPINNTAGGGVRLDGGDSRGNQGSSIQEYTAVGGTSSNTVRTSALHFERSGLSSIQYYDTSNKWTTTISSTGALTTTGTGSGASWTLTPTSGQNIHLKPTNTGQVIIGDGTTNYIAISASGEITLYGTAKRFHHTQISPTASIVSGSGFKRYGTTCVAGALSNQNTDLFFIEHEVYVGWDGANMFFEVDWLPDSSLSVGQTVIWKLKYRSIAEGEVIDNLSEQTLTLTYTSPTGGTLPGTIIHSRFTIAYNDATAPIVVDDHLHLLIYRDATADGYNGDCIISNFEFLWYSNSLSTV